MQAIREAADAQRRAEGYEISARRTAQTQISSAQERVGELEVELSSLREQVREMECEHSSSTQSLCHQLDEVRREAVQLTREKDALHMKNR
jgi:hypothetical protein